MPRMKQKLVWTLAGCLFPAAFVLSGCSYQQPPPDDLHNPLAIPAAEQSYGDTSSGSGIGGTMGGPRAAPMPVSGQNGIAGGAPGTVFPGTTGTGSTGSGMTGAGNTAGTTSGTGNR